MTGAGRLRFMVNCWWHITFQFQPNPHTSPTSSSTAIFSPPGRPPPFSWSPCHRPPFHWWRYRSPTSPSPPCLTLPFHSQVCLMTACQLQLACVPHCYPLYGGYPIPIRLSYLVPSRDEENNLMVPTLPLIMLHYLSMIGPTGAAINVPAAVHSCTLSIKDLNRSLRATLYF